jgi:hypothetical protein
MRKKSGLIAVLTLMFAMISCGGSTAPGGGGGGGGGGGNCPAGTFCMGSSTFFTAAGSATNPTVTVAPNTPVTWFNDNAGNHDVTFDDPSTALAVGNGNAGNIPVHTSGTNQRQFASAGTYHFHCVQHAPGMVGTVVVQ